MSECSFKKFSGTRERFMGIKRYTFNIRCAQVIIHSLPVGVVTVPNLM